MIVGHDLAREYRRQGTGDRREKPQGDAARSLMNAPAGGLRTRQDPAATFSASVRLLQDHPNDPRQGHSHGDPLTGRQRLPAAGPGHAGGQRRCQRVDQEHQPRSDLKHGLEEANVAEKETEEAGSGQ